MINDFVFKSLLTETAPLELQAAVFRALKANTRKAVAAILVFSDSSGADDSA